MILIILMILPVGFSRHTATHEGCTNNETFSYYDFVPDVCAVSDMPWKNKTAVATTNFHISSNTSNIADPSIKKYFDTLGWNSAYGLEFQLNLMLINALGYCFYKTIKSLYRRYFPRKQPAIQNQLYEDPLTAVVVAKLKGWPDAAKSRLICLMGRVESLPPRERTPCLDYLIEKIPRQTVKEVPAKTSS